MKEIYACFLGNVDASKSTTIGVLINRGKVLDDGNGLLRKMVCKHPHELQSGRTSDISQRYVVYDDCIVNFIDLCGHEKYLKTTVNGLSSIKYDLAVLCVSDKITRMTKEHLGLCMLLEIPILILFTKIDLVPSGVTTKLIQEMKSLLIKNCKRRMIEVKDKTDGYLYNNDAFLPYIRTSNTSGEGIDRVIEYIKNLPKKKYLENKRGFVVEHIYNVMGHGTILSGISGEEIRKGDVMYLGPISNIGNFIEIVVKSIHNDYRENIDLLPKNIRGCICIRFDKKYYKYIRTGMVVSKTIPKNVCKRFVAEVKIFHHQTTIQNGYQAYGNVGGINESVRILEIKGSNSTLRSGDTAIVVMEFVKNFNYVEVGDRVIFREGTTKGIGKIVEIL